VVLSVNSSLNLHSNTYNPDNFNQVLKKTVPFTEDRVLHDFSHMLHTASHKKWLIKNQKQRSIILPILNAAEVMVTW